MAETFDDDVKGGGERGEEEEGEEEEKWGVGRKEKRKVRKKMKRKKARKVAAENEREELERKLKDPEELRKFEAAEEAERVRMERERKAFEDREREWLEAMERKKKEEEEEELRKVLEEEKEEANRKQLVEKENECHEDDDWEYVEEGPAEIIWHGNEITFKKKKVRVPKKNVNQQHRVEDAERPTSNPLPPQSEAFAESQNVAMFSAQQMLENVAQQVPNFGTEQDKAHCPFHLKTGACRFGDRCSRVHFYPDKACTLLIKNMYNGPGLAWEQDEGLEYTDEEVEHGYEEFYEDVHTEFLKYGEIVNFKVCRNSSFHLRGNVYVHYKSLDSAVLAYQSFNGRYFAGKQIKLEFVNVTKWKVAICGEYMKSKLKTCSHGMACNFIHCFRNPGGDYEWADWDKPPPRYWVKKMASLFGYSVEFEYDKQMKQEKSEKWRMSSKTITTDADRHHVRRSRSRDVDYLTHLSSKSSNKEDDDQDITPWQRHRSDYNKRARIIDKKKNSVDHRKRSRSHDSSSDGEWSDRDSDGRRQNYRRHGRARKMSKHHTEMSEHKYKSEKNRTHQADSNEEWSEEDGNRNTLNDHPKNSRQQTAAAILDDNRNHANVGCGADGSGNKLDRDRDGGRKYHSRTRANSRQHGKKQSLNERGDVKSRTVDSDPGSSEESSYRNRGRHHNRASKSFGHEKELPEFFDDHVDDRHGIHDTDSDNDQLDSYREGNRSRGRRHLRHRESDSSDNEKAIVKPLKERSNSRESAIGKSHLGRNTTGSLKADENHESVDSDSYHGKYKSYDRNSRYISVQESYEQDRWQPESSEEDCNSRIKLGSVENHDSRSPDQCGTRSKSLDPSSGHSNNEKHSGDC